MISSWFGRYLLYLPIYFYTLFSHERRKKNQDPKFAIRNSVSEAMRKFDPKAGYRHDDESFIRNLAADMMRNL